MNSTASYLESNHFYEPFTTTLAGFIVPMFTGLVSATSSSLILYIIINSGIKLSSTYHRIMALMSCFDIISSTFIALGTIMMPSDNIYPFAGPMLGNTSTCKMQAWLIMFGISGNTCLNACLCWYFVCKITLKMGTKKIARYIEPIFYTFVSLISLIIPSFYLAKDLFNSNVYDNFCTVVPYPESCDEIKWYDWNECKWRYGALEKYFRNLGVLVVIVSFLFSLIVLSIAVILWTIFRTNKSIEQLISATVHEKSQVMEWDYDSRRIYDAKINQLSHLKYSRVLIYQALMYIAAFLSTWTFTVLAVIFNIASFELDAANCVLFPLQGFWNLFIFLVDKTYLIRLHREDRISFGQAVLILLKSPEEAPVFVLSNLSTVEVESDGVLTVFMARNPTEDLPSESTPCDSALVDQYEDLSELRIAESVMDSISERAKSKDALSKASFRSTSSLQVESLPREYRNTRKSFKS